MCSRIRRHIALRNVAGLGAMTPTPGELPMRE